MTTAAALPTVTVVVPSVRRPDDLRACLDSIAAQQPPPDDVVVVAQVADLETIAVAEERRVRVATVDEPGLAAAVERAIAAAETEIVAFIDDDARASDGWLARIRAAYASDDQLGFLGGRDHVNNDRDAGSERLVVNRFRGGRFQGNNHLGKGTAREADHVKGANMSFRARAVRGLPVGALVVGSGAQAGNELIPCFAATKAGYRGRYDPSVAVEHYPAERLSGDGRTVLSSARVAQDIQNQATAVMLFRTPIEVAQYVVWIVFVGDRRRPGLIKAVALLASDPRAMIRFLAVHRGLWRGIRQRRAMSAALWQSEWGQRNARRATV